MCSPCQVCCSGDGHSGKGGLSETKGTEGPETPRKLTGTKPWTKSRRQTGHIEAAEKVKP